MEKSLVIINEPFEEMVLGKNATLSYIAAALDLGHETFIYNLPKNPKKNILPRDLSSKIDVIKISPGTIISDILISNYQEQNENLSDRIKKSVETKDSSLFQEIQNQKVSQILTSPVSSVTLENITNIIQRIEPMKAPFPPQGNCNLSKSMQEISTLFPHLPFNYPLHKIGDEERVLIDKQTPQIINNLLEEEGLEEIATPTKEFLLGDCVAEIFSEIIEKYKKLFPNTSSGKIVLKPKDSAQSLGVFALEFTDSKDSFNLESLQRETPGVLEQRQIYKINSLLVLEELRKITEILCYIQSIKTNKIDLLAKENVTISNIPEEEILKVAKNLFNGNILVQPFLEGVTSGDVRANIIKNSENIFELSGMVFRKSLQSIEQNKGDKFTTCLTGGESIPLPISVLEPREQINLIEKAKILLDFLNKSPLKESYAFSNELGADFMLLGDGKNTYLGEVNHFCPALAPLSEIMNRLNKPENGLHDGGLGIAKSVINSQISYRDSKNNLKD